MELKKITKTDAKKTCIILVEDVKDLKTDLISASEKKYILSEIKTNKRNFFPFNRLSHFVFIQLVKSDKSFNNELENCRKAGDELQQILNKHNVAQLQVIDQCSKKEQLWAFLEGFVLGAYQYNKFKTKATNNAIKFVEVLSKSLTADLVKRFNVIAEAVYACRDMVNEPHNFQSAQQLSAQFLAMGKASGAKVTVLDKTKIKALKMGGLLGVNQGSIDPPTFTVMEWKPTTKKKLKTVALVGKGVVFDAGGMNIKTGGYMSDMKQDMAGAATMASVICAAAKLNLPLHILAFLPATDNRLNGNALVPGNVIRMFDGTTVEIDNTDAEGRLILADAISYAEKYQPDLIVDAATLTGAASRAIGKYGIVAMQQNAEKSMEILKKVGESTYERIAEFPFWEEYGDLIKSPVADLKNSGAAEAGMITAGKFLAHFAKSPYIHLDIAGVAFATARHGYRGLGGTATGVRLLIDFLTNFN